MLQTPLLLTSQFGRPILSLLVTSYQELAVNPGNRALELELYIGVPHLPKGFLFTLPPTLPLEPQWEHILHGL